MIQKILFGLCVLAVSIFGLESQSFSIQPVIRQSGLFFSSDRVTIGGIGFGFNANCQLNKNLRLQPEVSVLWANGNAISTLLTFSYHKSGIWQPGSSFTNGLLWGQREEILANNGQRPISPIYIAGLRVSPLTFKTSVGFVSLLEFGGGIGPYHGRFYECNLISIAMWK